MKQGAEAPGLRHRYWRGWVWAAARRADPSSTTASAHGAPPQRPREPPGDPFGLTPLEGAFSREALACQFAPGLRGAFPDVVGRPGGPIAMAVAHDDLACTLAYAPAPLLSFDRVSAIGGGTDTLGARCAIEAQHLDPGSLAPDVATDAFGGVPGQVDRFRSDAYIGKAGEVDAPIHVANAMADRLAGLMTRARPASSRR